mmetsp:Transcript_55687/g.63940  ORF Transcript_55687/g.63940 Transcript_55687/m.63940 type:complete len:352 (+) Transcript_55687:89-1144(+)
MSVLACWLCASLLLGILYAVETVTADQVGIGVTDQQLTEQDIETALNDLVSGGVELTPRDVAVVLSKRMGGRWTSTWTHACSHKVTKGHVAFLNASKMFFAYRREDGEKVDESISGEGITVPYLPFMKRFPRPYTNGEVELNYGYQLCTSLKYTIATPSDGIRTFGPESEVRVMRGFVFEDTYDDEGRSLVHDTLDRCVEGLNRNYNFFVTTIGTPFDDTESVDLTHPLAQNLRYVKWQFRLPGITTCDAAQIPKDESFTLSSGSDIGASDDAFDTLVWVRSDPPQPGSFFDEHYHMLAFGFLFIVFRIYTSYRFHSQKHTIQKSFLQEVTAEETKMKKAMLEKTNLRKTK